MIQSRFSILNTHSAFEFVANGFYLKWNTESFVWSLFFLRNVISFAMDRWYWSVFLRPDFFFIEWIIASFFFSKKNWIRIYRLFCHLIKKNNNNSKKINFFPDWNHRRKTGANISWEYNYKRRAASNGPAAKMSICMHFAMKYQIFYATQLLLLFRFCFAIHFFALICTIFTIWKNASGKKIILAFHFNELWNE